MKRSQLIGSLACATSAVTCLSLIGCRSPQDSWEHFATGGMLDIGQPALDRDGTVYFVSPVTGRGDIYSWCSLTGLKRLTYSEKFEGDPVVSDDGEKLYFSREHGGDSHIFSIHLQTRLQQQITSGSAIDTPLLEVFGGKYLLVRRGLYSFGGNATTSTFYLVPLQNSGEQWYNLGNMAAVDPKGNYILASSNSQLRLLDIHNFQDGGKTITCLGFNAIPWAVSSDGACLVVSELVGAETWKFDAELFHVDLTTNIVLPIGGGHSVAVDNKSKSVLFSKGLENQIYLFDVYDGIAEIVVNKPAFRTHFKVDPSGRFAVYAAMNRSKGEHYDIFAFDFQTKSQKLVYSVNGRSIPSEIGKPE